jgi:TonB family protein
MASAKESAAQPEVAPKTSPVNAPPVNTAIPPVIKMDGPKNEVVEITLPNGPRTGSTLLNLPGERVIQSAAVTMHVQRAVVVDGGQGWWSSNRKKKVVLGELAERVDPQTPRQQNGREGRVSVRAIIGKDGRIERVRPVNGSIALVPSVVRAIREWRFEPTFVDGKPVETGVLLAVEFHGPESAASKP